MSSKITSEHLERKAIVYVRQSTAAQVADHRESQHRQYALKDVARNLGFHDIEIIDDDLGRSATGFTERPGFQRLLAAVSSGHVGAVLSLEASRLARNDRDWTRLVEIGAITGTVLVDHDGVYDPCRANDRLLLGLKGIMSQWEILTLRQRAYEAVRAKAARGELYVHLPTGLVYRPDEKIDIDPDVRVQEAVHLVFRKFDELGSARQVLLWFVREEMSLPIVRRNRQTSSSIDWDLPKYHLLLGMLKNPFYAGAYAWGRTESRTEINHGRISRTSGHAKAIEDWEVLIRDHHPGYIDWQRYIRNRDILEENAFMKPSSDRKSARGGRSLLAGLLRCRRCGYMLDVSYRGPNSTTPSFRCRRNHHAHGADFCISFSGARVEQSVSDQILEAVEPRAIQAAIQAAENVSHERADQRKALVLELENAEYEARLAARRYERVDPDQRLVAAQLEVRWNAALERLQHLKTRLKAFDTERSTRRPIDEQQLLALAADVPTLWHDENTDMRLKQRIVRILIREIIVDVDDDSSEVICVLHWEGGRHTEFRVSKPSRGRTQRCTDEDTVELVKRMATRWNDKAIASSLNRMGSNTATGKTWNAARVRALRSRLNLPAFDPDHRDPSVLTSKEAAERLGISPQYLGLLLSKGLIPGRQVAPGTPWQIDADVLDSDAVQQTLQKLRQRRRVKSPRSDRNLRIPGL